jgi:2-aminoadipate transaminase
MRVEALEAELEQHARRGELARVKAIYITSYFDNPRGVSLAAERRRAVVELAERYSREQRIYVIEDAAYRELGFGAADHASLRAHDRSGETVIYTGTFSKSFAPGVRVGYGILPRTLIDPVVSLKGNLDFGSPHLNQRMVSEVLRLGLYEPHVALLRALYAKKAECMGAALDEHIVRPGLGRYVRPAGGLYYWLELPSQLDTGERGELLGRALEQGVLYVPGEYCYAQPPAPHSSAMRLTFGVQSEERLAAGIEKLARAVRRSLR